VKRADRGDVWLVDLGLARMAAVETVVKRWLGM
jgi:hypothetical protein